MEITWFGHAAFMIKTETWTCLLDPWLENPLMKETHKSRPTLPSKIDAILISHGHVDHVGEAVELARNHHATIYCIHELACHLEPHGVPLVSMNKGGSLELQDAKIHMVEASHSSSICGLHNEMHCGGAAAAWIVSVGGHVVYHSGDTDVFGDMKLINELYQPTIGLLCIGDHYTMGPQGASYALNHLLTHITLMIPMHYGTFPLLRGRPEQMKITRPNLTIHPLKPGESIKLD
jgi:L-ascorbate metabolism protein UlaG (beta-lactamase superfamily)